MQPVSKQPVSKQPVSKQSAARRATAGLAVANSRERNNAESLPHERSDCFGYDCFLTGPEGASQDISLKEYYEKD
jgi:hypothetical protein